MDRRVCKHSFSAIAIKEYLHGKTSVVCPASGCNKRLTINDLKEDPELAKQAKEAARRERMREDDSDEDDGVVE